MRFGYVAPPFEGVWFDAVALLDKAVRKGGNEWSDVRRALWNETAQLWLTVEDKPVAAFVTRMDGDTIECWLAGGKVGPTAPMIEQTILKAAREGGATNARIVGRKGWARVFKPYGWRVQDDELVKDFA